jgi:hypothetical protein
MTRARALRLLLPLLLLAGLPADRARAQAEGSPASGRDGAGARSYLLEGFLGAVANVATPLWIHQDGEPDLSTTGRYATRPFERPLYYAFRIGTRKRGAGWDVELIHQKLHLRRKPDPVERFSISHGYNLVLVNRAAFRRGGSTRIGLGVVIAHPETRVRGRDGPRSGGLGGGYYLTGPAAQIAAGGGWPLIATLGIGLRLEGKLTAAFAEVPIANGEARVPNLAFHLLLGLGHGARPRGE